MTSDTVDVKRLKAYDIAHERWLIAQVTCTCGGHWDEVGPQCLVDEGGVAHDTYAVTCGECGRPAELRFDISAFFGRESHLVQWLDRVAPGLDASAKKKVIRKIGPPLLTRVRAFIFERAKDGDLDTLRYLREQIAVASGKRSLGT